MAGILEKIAANAAKAKQLTEQLGHSTPPEQSAQVLHLPLWPEAVRAVPNSVLRSALFGAIKRGARAYLERVKIHAQDGIEIRYTGARLDQGDLDVWATVLHVVREQALGDECCVTAYQLLKALGKTDTGKNRDTLDRRLSRLNATALQVKVGRYSYEGSLIAGVDRDEITREYIIRLDSKLCSLFEPDQFTQVEWAVRHALDGQPLAQWLHGFYASHAKPFPMRMDTLLELSGSENTEPRSSRQKLRKALDAVMDASAANGEGFSYEVHGDLVHVEKKPNGSQRRHLAKKAATTRKPRA
ncbi:Plasmid replication initiator protein TrfA [compost metagenome]